jgi:hypothetical protein
MICSDQEILIGAKRPAWMSAGRVGKHRFKSASRSSDLQVAVQICNSQFRFAIRSSDLPFTDHQQLTGGANRPGHSAAKNLRILPMGLAAASQVSKRITAGVADDYLFDTGLLRSLDQVEKNIAHLIPEADIGTQDQVKFCQSGFGQTLKAGLFGLDPDPIDPSVQLQVWKHVLVCVHAGYPGAELFGTVDPQQPPSTTNFKHAGMLLQRIGLQVLHEQKAGIPELVAMYFCHMAYLFKAFYFRV